MRSWSQRERLIWFVGLILTLVVAYFNHGIIALDDYSEGFARFIPAQNHTFKETAGSAGIRLPFQAIFLLGLSKTALGLGLSDPTSQLRFVLMLIGAFVFCAHTLSAISFFRDSRQRLIVLTLSSFYFILPLIYTRPLIENLSGAFISLGAFGAFRFYHAGKNRWIAFSVLAISVASLFRFQTGVCIFALPLLFFTQKNKSAWMVFLASGLLAFLGTGLLDLFLTRGFHRSLRAYVDYNIHHASSYGTTPFYTFLLLFLGLSIPPTFIARYQGFDWRERYSKLLPIVFFFTVFVVAHSLIPHKEERFMVPVLVLFLVLLTPLAHYWIFEKKSRWRVIYFCGLNFTLLPLACFSTPQNNVISLVRYVGDHPHITKVIDYEDSIVLVPRAFSLRAFDVSKVAGDLSEVFKLVGCNAPLAVRQDKLDSGFDLGVRANLLAQFQPGPLEALLVRLNPRQNSRRGTIFLFSPKGCT